MKKLLILCCFGIVAFAACTKKVIDHVAAENLSIQTNDVGPVSICPWTCRITKFIYPYYSLFDGSYDDGIHSDDLISFLDVHSWPYGFQYDASGKLIACRGEAQSACHRRTYLDSFFYSADEKLQTLLTHKVYTNDPGCPVDPLNNLSWNYKVDFTYGLIFKAIGNLLIPVRTITGIVSLSDTVPEGAAVNHYNLTGEKYYYEFTDSRLTLKRHTRPSAVPVIEYVYTYNTNGNVSKVVKSNQGGSAIAYWNFTSYDNKQNIVSGNEVWQLLVGDFNKNNPTDWYRAGIFHSSATYKYNPFCFPGEVQYTFFNNPPDQSQPVNYNCQ